MKNDEKKIVDFNHEYARILDLCRTNQILFGVSPDYMALGFFCRSSLRELQAVRMGMSVKGVSLYKFRKFFDLQSKNVTDACDELKLKLSIAFPEIKF